VKLCSNGGNHCLLIDIEAADISIRLFDDVRGRAKAIRPLPDIACPFFDKV
jgi:hypothetical protein